MLVHRIGIAESPQTPGRVRLSARVTYDGPGSRGDDLWFEVSQDDAAGLTTSANPWLVALAPLGATLDEPLRVDADADDLLVENLRELLRVWASWYPTLGVPSIECADRVAVGPTTAAPAATSPSDRRTASFFSGGVDSFFTALRHAAGDGTPRTHSIDDLIFIHGFDIPRTNVRARDTALKRLRPAAERLEKRLVVIETNLRETRFAETDWSGLSHAAALAACGLALENAYEALLIPSSAGYRDLRFWGSHPLTDPLFTSSRTTVVHDGPAFMRVEKTEYVARSDVALEVLRVCWKSEDGTNCGRCNNCYRTMLALEALGVLGDAATFDRDDLDLTRARRIYCPESFDVRQFGYVRDLAIDRERADIVAAVEASLEASARVGRWIGWLRGMRDLPLMWRWAPRLERWLLRGWVT